MTNQIANPLELSRAELVYGLTLFGKTKIVGAKFLEFDLNVEALESVQTEGRDSLVARGLALKSNQEEITLLPEFEKLLRALVDRNEAILLVLDSKGRGRYAFAYNLYDDWIVEHFVNDDSAHTLTVFETFGIFFERLSRVIPLQAVDREGRPTIILEMPKVEQIVALAQNENSEKVVAEALKKEGVNAEYIERLSSAISNPLLTVSIAYLVSEDDEAVEASSCTIFGDEHSVWGIWPKDMKSNPPKVWIMPSGINDIHSALIDWMGIRETLTGD